jgi:hypothetical protein
MGILALYAGLPGFYAALLATPGFVHGDAIPRFWYIGTPINGVVYFALFRLISISIRKFRIVELGQQTQP